MQIKVIFWLKMTKTFIYNYPYKISLIKFVLSGSNFAQFSKITKICKQIKYEVLINKKLVQQLAFHIQIIIFGQNSLKSATASGCHKKVMMKTSSCMTTFSCMTWIHANFAFQVGLGKKVSSFELFIISMEVRYPIYVQCNLDLVTLLVSAKTVTKLHNITKSNDFM